MGHTKYFSLFELRENLWWDKGVGEKYYVSGLGCARGQNWIRTKTVKILGS